MTIAKDMMVNDGIRARELRLIDQNGEQLGVKSKAEALQIAERANLDVVLVAPNAKPPVARIMDYGKYRFEQQKKDREARKKQKVSKSSVVSMSSLSFFHMPVYSIMFRDYSPIRKLGIALNKKSARETRTFSRCS